ncbi:MAG: hypothetical protein AAB693_00675, partial [Patescibacteria group bacterium]
SFMVQLKNSLDCLETYNSELCYENIKCNKCYKTFFSEECDSCIDTYFSKACSNCNNIFGCVNLKRKEYCILNKQYSKEEYEKLVPQIIQNMKDMPYIDKIGRKWFYGEFLPLDFSPFAYNETMAQTFFPKTQEEALAEGFKWYEGEGNKYTITKKAQDLPDTISETEESILKEVIECQSCQKAYRFTIGEYNLIKQLNLPLPHECFNCRQKFRFTRLRMPKLYDRTCAKCNKEIKTSFALERPEIVYCEKCYQQEVY